MKPDLHEFVTAARAFCALAEQDGNLPSDETDLWRIRDLLLRLMQHIPAVDAAPSSVGDELIKPDKELCLRASKRFSGFAFNGYRTIFDPHDFDAEEPTMGLLSDDLTDIYRELSDGLSRLDHGSLEAACLDWSFSYRLHWARHAVSAFMAIELYRIDQYKDVGRL